MSLETRVHLTEAEGAPGLWGEADMYLRRLLSCDGCHDKVCAWRWENMERHRQCGKTAYSLKDFRDDLN